MDELISLSLQNDFRKLKYKPNGQYKAMSTEYKLWSEKRSNFLTIDSPNDLGTHRTLRDGNTYTKA